MKHVIISLKHCILLFFRELLFPSPPAGRTVTPCQRIFIITTPQGYTRVITRPHHVINSFFPNIIQKLLVPRIHRASKHKIMPHHNPILVTQFKENIILVYSATPYPQHIHVSIRGIGNHFLVHLSIRARQKNIIRYNIRPFGKNGYTIQFKTERFAPLILLPYQFQ